MGTNSPNAQEDPGHGFVSAIRRAFRSRSPIVEDVVARDIAEFLRGDTDEEDSGPKSDISSDAEAGPTLYRPPSLGVAYGPSRPIVSELGPHIEPHPSHEDRKKSREAELELLRESHVLPVHLPAKEEGKISALAVFFRKLLWRDEAESAAGPGEVGGEDVSQENSPLLQRQGRESQAHLNEIWDEAVADDRVRTSWSRETKVLSRYSAPLILAFMMQYSINVTSILAVGRIGKMELGAVSRMLELSLSFYPTGSVPLPPLKNIRRKLIRVVCSCKHDSGNNVLRPLRRVCLRPRHPLLPSLWRRPPPPRRPAVPAHVLLPSPVLRADFVHLVARRGHPSPLRAGTPLCRVGWPVSAGPHRFGTLLGHSRGRRALRPSTRTVQRWHVRAPRGRAYQRLCQLVAGVEAGVGLHRRSCCRLVYADSPPVLIVLVRAICGRVPMLGRI